MVHNAWVPTRRLLLFVTLMLLLGVFASAIAPPRRKDVVQRPSGGATTPPARVVSARLPRDREVRAAVGDVVSLQVTSEERDVAQIVTLGVSEPVEADLPAELVFDADRAGRFAVTLRDDGRRVGLVVVADAN